MFHVEVKKIMLLITGEKISKNSEYVINPGSFNFFWTKAKTIICVISLKPKTANAKDKRKLQERSTTKAE